jgi:hypothetical protein
MGSVGGGQAAGGGQFAGAAVQIGISDQGDRQIKGAI